MMKLLKLTLHNFKGLRKYSVEPHGESINIYGQNASGKTTIADAVSWLLFDKDTQDKSPAAFGIKTLDENGQPLSGVEHSVEAKFSLEGFGNLTLKKVYKEKWTKKRGSSKSELTNHTTDHYWDEEPVSAKDYKERIADIMPEERFKILTLPSYFAEIMHWKDRREVLTGLCGDIRDEDIVEGNSDLEGYTELLNGKSQEAQEKILRDRKKNLNEEIDNIPSRVDELTNLIKDVEGVEESRKVIDSLKKEKAGHEDKLSQVKAGGGVAELNVKVQEIEAEQAKFINQFNASIEENLKGAREKVSDLESKVDESTAELNTATREYNQAKSGVEAAEEDAVKFYDQMVKVQAKKPDPRPEEGTQLEECPMCGQTMPEKKEDHEDHYESYLKSFNQEKAQQVKDLQEQRNEADKKVEDLKKVLKEKEVAGLAARSKDTQRKEALKKAKAELDRQKNEQPAVSDNPEYKKFEAKKAALLEKLKDIKNERQSQINEIEHQISLIDEKIEEHQAVIHQAKSNQEYNTRIAELRESLKQYADDLEEVEQSLFLIEDFNRAKADYITDQVNDKFKMVRWRLFKEQINGGMTETCDPVVNGIPFSEGLNNAARVQAGIDIIETLASHYGYSAPVFVDNRESVTDLPETDLQIISLVVSPSHKSLTVKTEQQLQVA